MLSSEKNRQLLIGLGLLAAVILVVFGIRQLDIRNKNAVTATAMLKQTEWTKNTSSAAAQPVNNTFSAPDKNVTSSTFKDGTFNSTGSYYTPESTESIDVSLVLSGGVVVDSAIKQSPQKRESKLYQAQFAESYKQQIIGKKIDSIKLDRVSGSSLTPIGFNDALEKIKQQASN